MADVFGSDYVPKANKPGGEIKFIDPAPLPFGADYAPKQSAASAPLSAAGYEDAALPRLGDPVNGPLQPSSAEETLSLIEKDRGQPFDPVDRKKYLAQIESGDFQDIRGLPVAAPLPALGDFASDGPSNPRGRPHKRNVGVGESVARMAALGENTAVTPLAALPALPLVVMDALKGLVTGGNKHEMGDTYFENVVRPQYDLGERLAIDPATEQQTLPAHVSGQVAEFVPTLLNMLATGSAGKASEAGAGAKTAIPRIVNFLRDAFAKSARASPAAAIPAGAEQYKASLDQGQSAPEAGLRDLGAMGETAAANAIPLAAKGGPLVRTATGAVSMPVVSNLLSLLHGNGLLPWQEDIAPSIIGAGLGGVMGERPTPAPLPAAIQEALAPKPANAPNAPARADATPSGPGADGGLPLDALQRLGDVLTSVAPKVASAPEAKPGELDELLLRNLGDIVAPESPKGTPTAAPAAQVPVDAAGSRSTGAEPVVPRGETKPAIPETKVAPAETAPAKVDLEPYRNEIGWTERGGEIEGEGQMQRTSGDVVGRTKWVGKFSADGGESMLWRNRPDPSLTEAEANKALDKYRDDKPLGPREQRFVDHALRMHQADREAQQRPAREAAASLAEVDETPQSVETETDRQAYRANLRAEAGLPPIEDTIDTSAPAADPRDAEIQRLHGLAYSDELTGLANRRAYNERTPKAAHVFADLRGFKGVNDKIGYDAGDTVLKAFAQALKTARGNRSGEVYRTGGDEFRMEFDSEADARDAVHDLERIARTVRLKFTGKDGTVVHMDGIAHAVGIGHDERSAGQDYDRNKLGSPATRRGDLPETFGASGTQLRGTGRSDGSEQSDRQDGNPPAESAGRVSESPPSDLFGKPSAKETIDAETRRRDAERDGKTGAGRTDMLAGEGELFAGKRPEQGDIETPKTKRSEPEPTVGLGKNDIQPIADRIAGEHRDNVVVTPFEKLPQVIRDAAADQGAEPREIKAVFHRGKVYLVEGHLPDAAAVESSMFHEFYGHFGLRNKYGNAVDAKLQEVLRGVGGIDGVLALAKKQGIELGDYERGILGNKSIPEKQQHAILAEELLAHMAETKGTLRRVVEEIVGAIRAFLRARGFPKMAELGVTDLAHILKEARDSLETKAGQGEGVPVFQRRAITPEDDMPEDRREAGTDVVPASSDNLPSRRPGESQSDYTRRVLNTSGDAIKLALQESKRQQKIGRGTFRAMLAQRDRAIATADQAFAEVRKHFDKRDDSANLSSIDQWETGQPVTDANASKFFDAMQTAFDQRIERIRALNPNALQDVIENYFPHIWEDSAKALKWYQGFMAKRPLEGNKAFLKQRTWGTIKEGMASGLKPVSTNPVDLVLLKIEQMDKFIAFHEFRKDLEARGWLKKIPAGERIPPGYAMVDDAAFKSSHAFVVKGEEGDTAATKHWNHVVPEALAKDINGYLAPSLYRFGAWKALRTFENMLMSARLGWSMFHAGFTTTDNLILHADVAGRRLMNGDIAGGLETLVKTPFTMLLSPIEGHALNKQWLGQQVPNAHTEAILHALEQGGARWKMSPTEYNNALPKILRAVRQRSARGTLKELLPAVGEASSWVIHHWLVPNQKMAARVMLMKFELDRVAGQLGKERGDYKGLVETMHPDTLRQIAGKVVDVIDDRLGHMTYDNQFWNKTAREVSQALIGAVGWQVGTLRTVTGGVHDLKHLWSPEKLVAPLDKAGNITDGDMGRVSGRLTYLLTLGLTMGGLSAITQYLLTGEGPDEAKDYFFPKTGRKNDDGTDERLQFPSYWMDHYKLATHPLVTAEHKVHPALSMMLEALTNKDYFGTKVRDEDASWLEQAKQVGEFVAKGFLPYTWTNQAKLSDSDASPGRSAANFFGVTTAPASVSQTPFQKFVFDKAYEHVPQGARSAEHARYAKERKAAAAALRRGEHPNLSNFTNDAKKDILRDARFEVPALKFKNLGFLEKLRAYDLASAKERRQYQLADIILHHTRLRQALGGLTSDERKAVLTKLKEIQADEAAP